MSQPRYNAFRPTNSWMPKPKIRVNALINVKDRRLGREHRDAGPVILHERSEASFAFQQRNHPLRKPSIVRLRWFGLPP